MGRSEGGQRVIYKTPQVSIEVITHDDQKTKVVSGFGVVTSAGLE